MTRTEFIEFALINDISFSYHKKDYCILQGNNTCICGEDGKTDMVVFDQFPDVYRNIEDMLDTWRIDGVLLKDLIEETKFYGN